LRKTNAVICTIGYSGLAPFLLRRIAKTIDADVIDCRQKPTSRNASYRQGPLKKLLGERYIWAGDVLGGYGHTSAKGINFLKKRKRNSLLLCMCHAPGDCHRHVAICRKSFPNAVHIFDDELILSSELTKAIRDDTNYNILGSLADLLTGRTKLHDLLT
jgi:hypothetical protein